METVYFKKFKIRWFLTFWIVLNVLSLFFLLDGSATTATNDFVNFVMIFLMCGYMIWFSLKHDIRYNDVMAKEALQPKRLLKYIGVSIYIKLLAITIVTAFLSALLYIFFDVIEKFLPLLGDFTIVSKSGIALFIYSITVVILAPIWEELFFRGILLRRFGLRFTTPVAIVLSSMIFGLAHIGGNSMINAFLLGCFLSFAYLKTKSIVVPIVLHVISNFLSVIILWIPAIETDDINFMNLSLGEIKESLLIYGIAAVVLTIISIVILWKKWPSIKGLPSFKHLKVQLDEQKLALEGNTINEPVQEDNPESEMSDEATEIQQSIHLDKEDKG